VSDLFAGSPWPGVVIWAALYVSDYVWTITCARMYQTGVRERICFQGSYEITPYYQGDVDALRRISPRFVFMLVVTCALQAHLWWTAMRGGFSPEVYEIALGAMILIELTIHVRHVRNYSLFRAALAGRGISGRIEYARAQMLKQSAIELWTFAILYASVAAITRSWFVSGGAVACAMLAASHQRLAGKDEAITRTSAPPPDGLPQRAAPGGGTP
jgi:hypothetical protein